MDPYTVKPKIDELDEYGEGLKLRSRIYYEDTSSINFDY